jgi:hypothetical protein
MHDDDTTNETVKFIVTHGRQQNDILFIYIYNREIYWTSKL